MPLAARALIASRINSSPRILLSRASSQRIRPCPPTPASFRFRSHSEKNMEPIFTKNAPSPVGPYSQAVKTATAVYCSGAIPLSAEGVLVDGTVEDKTKQCIENLKAILEEAGSSIEKVVKVTVFLADMGDFVEMNAEYEKWFPHKPARSCVAVKTLPKNVDVEIECIALP